MKKALFVLVVSFLLALGASAWGQCPEDPNDKGQCDTIYAEVYDSAKVQSFPGNVRLMFLFTHDLSFATDSIAGIVVPVKITERTNPSMYCSISVYWNSLSLSPYDPAMPRSIFRDMPDNDNPVIFNRMFAMDRDFSQRGWDFRYVVFGEASDRFLMSLTPTGAQDQRWWEGSRVLLATATLRVQDTMTICIDSTLWPPSSRLSMINDFDASTFIPRHNFPYCFKVQGPVDVRETHGSEDSRPSEFQLSQNYPNPFNAATNIEFAVIKATRVTLEVFNIVGQKVKTLVDQDMKPGTYVADWDSKDENGQPVSSGIYFYRMQAGDFSDMKKMLLLK